MAALVYVQLIDAQPVRIYRRPPYEAMDALPAGHEIRLWPRAEAVTAIRRAVFARSRGQCEDCGSIITWKSMHLHERKLRSDGGEIGLSNSTALCFDCHEGPRGAHANRLPQFGITKERTP